MKFWKLFKSIINIVVTIITLLNFFLKINSIQELIKDTFIENIVNIKYRNIIVVITLSIFIICWIVSYFMENHKSITTEKKKHELFHEIRNESFAIKKFTKNTHDAYDIAAKASADKICKEISEYLKEKYKKDYHVCLKFMEISSSRTTKSIDEIRVKTLGRGGHDLINRTNSDKGSVAVKDDTSYTQILSNEKDGRKSSYTCHNLPIKCLMSKVASNPYLPEFKSFCRKYLSTIVVPIRIDTGYLMGINNKNERRYQVLGFLCLDYKHIMHRRRAQCLNEELKSIADSLYILFDEIMYKDEELIKKYNLVYNT